MPKLFIMLPTLDEEKAIENVISRIPVEELEKIGFDVTTTIVDGGSKDNTVEIAK